MSKTIEAVGISRQRGESKDPPFGTARNAASGTVPRGIDPLERIGRQAGVNRYRLSCHNYDHHAIRYCLAKSADEAQAWYRKETKLDDTLARCQGGRKEKPDDPDIVCVQLDD